MNQKTIDLINEISKILFSEKIHYELLITRFLIQIKSDSFTIFIRKEKKERFFDFINTSDLSLNTFVESDELISQLFQSFLTQ